MGVVLNSGYFRILLKTLLGFFCKFVNPGLQITEFFQDYWIIPRLSSGLLDYQGGSTRLQARCEPLGVYTAKTKVGITHHIKRTQR